MSVILINAFEVPADADADFVGAWDRTDAAMRAQPGFVSRRLHRSLAPQADFRYVNVAEWTTPDAFAAALGSPAFQEAARTLPFTSHPALYEVVRS